MSNQSSTFDQSMSLPALRKPGRGFFRSFFAVWIAAYGNRIDSHGRIMIEG
ncbi:hypothetical protein SRABI118_00304 [Massilia sp. Bi118]|uniref:hypothetical protein n=1 Tax=Massilia sp. Bi118 TaxID=2822346 RepID=UPI001DDD97FB|nr:hypothetical protein [Massilia sp. Bi118]CAH0141813.1 hypothetical protein SRABI118_00304 [Massilia sp. Bi118]